MHSSNRLYFRKVALTDLKNIHALHSLPETDRYNTMGIPANIETTEQLITEWLTKQEQHPGSSYIFCVELKESHTFIGLIGLMLGKLHYKTAEVWFKTHVHFWGKGFTTEALIALINFGFNDLKLHRIEAGCAAENIASIKVLEKAGMKMEGMKRKKLPIRGNWVDNYFYAILEEDLKN